MQIERLSLSTRTLDRAHQSDGNYQVADAVVDPECSVANNLAEIAMPNSGRSSVKPSDPAEVMLTMDVWLSDNTRNLLAAESLSAQLHQPALGDSSIWVKQLAHYILQDCL
jgi:hypothetical protein